ncbi:hypothetical protein ABKY47_002046 [Aeromonas hydrophila]
MTTQAISEYSLGTIAPTGPAKFPASLAPQMIRSKLNSTAIKVVVLVATDQKRLLKDISQAITINPDMKRLAAGKIDAHIYRGNVQFQSSGGNNPCLAVLAASQDDPAFGAIKFAAGGEPMQVIALHGGELVKGSGYQELVASLSGAPLQLEYEL